MSAESSALQGATLLISLQILSRLLTFVLNQSLLRFLSPSLLGVSAQLELFAISILFFSRESLRVALQRQTGKLLQPVINIAYIPLLLGIPLTVLVRWLYVRKELPDIEYIHLTLNVQAAATILELLSEPLFAIAQFTFLYSARATAEGTATIVKCATTFSLFFYAHGKSIEVGALPFAIGQLTFAITLLLIYAYRTTPLLTLQKATVLPTLLPASPEILRKTYFPASILSLSMAIYAQSSLKYLLTQGDAILVAYLTTLSDQGAYALASNYGGLVARLLFQPIEESSRNLFGRLCAVPDADSSPPTSTATTPPAPKTKNTKEREDEKEIKPQTKQPSPSNLHTASRTLHTILKAYSLLSLPILTLGPYLASPFLHLIAGPKWSTTQAPQILAIYTFLIPLLAINGITEAFIAAVSSKTELHSQSILMAFFSVVFGCTSFLLLSVMQLGARGLVWGNILNMTLRVIWSTRFIHNWFASRKVDFKVVECLPSATSIGSAAIVVGLLRGIQPGWAVLVLSRLRLQGTFLGRDPFADLIEKGVYAVLLLLGMGIGERSLILDGISLVRSRIKKE